MWGLGGSWGGLGRVLEYLGDVSGVGGGALWGSWGRLGVVLGGLGGVLGTIWRPRPKRARGITPTDQFWGRFGPILEAFWVAFSMTF